MNTEERVKLLEEELHTTKVELQQILLDIRTLQMEVQTPLPADARRGKFPSQQDTKKGVETDGSQ